MARTVNIERLLAALPRKNSGAESGDPAADNLTRAEEGGFLLFINEEKIDHASAALGRHKGSNKFIYHKGRRLPVPGPESSRTIIVERRAP